MNVNGLYFIWLKDKVCQHDPRFNRYDNLLRWLFYHPYKFLLPRDEYRGSDGIQLRYSFGLEKNIDQPIIASELDCNQCSLLEMFAALIMRSSYYAMENPEDKWISQTFWMILDNLDLLGETDDRFDEAYVENAIHIWEWRLYEYDGTGGGMVHLKYPREDLTHVELWYQMMWYITENSNLEVW